MKKNNLRKYSYYLSLVLCLNLFSPILADIHDRIEYKLERLRSEVISLADFIENGNTITADYVIVGGGTAGMALAAKLSDADPITGNFTNSVVVLEAGINLTEDPIVLDINNFVTAAYAYNPRISLPSYPFLDPSNPYINTPYSQGIMWGGSSGHDYMLTVRGTPSIYDQWAAISGNSAWSYNSLLTNVMLPMEHYIPDLTPLDPTQRGTTGPLFISQYPPLNEADPLLVAYGSTFGIPFVDDYNNPNEGDVGISAYQSYVTSTNPANGYRSFSGNAYLTGEASVGVPAIVNANGQGLGGRKLQIISTAHANRVTFSTDNVAQGVEYVLADVPNQVFFAKAKKEVILSAGSFSDPAILQRSGIGDVTLLDSLGIPVVYANSNVGQHLKTHMSQQAIIDGVAPTFSAASAYSGFAPTTNTRTTQALFYPFIAFFPPSVLAALGITAGINVITFNMTPGSEGSVEIVSRDPFIVPLVNFNWYSDGGVGDAGSDANKAVTYYQLLDSAVTTAGGSLLYPTPDQYASGPAALLDAAKATNVTANHASSTCRMAQTASTGVVDGQGRVFGVTGLRVASNSTVPVISDGNTRYTALMIGLQIARAIRGL